MVLPVIEIIVHTVVYWIRSARLYPTVDIHYFNQRNTEVRIAASACIIIVYCEVGYSYIEKIIGAICDIFLVKNGIS